ncbi:MAG: DUF4198 domain-containing protein [Desulfonauticus sp.]|nr:DUF4198 domain-containing protein [Desulfonauticus sp.]
MSKLKFFLILVLLIIPISAYAHFGFLIPQKSMITPETKTIKLMLAFIHPTEMKGMELVLPKKFGVKVGNKILNLKKRLKKIKFLNHTAWESTFKFKRPGVYQFFMEPTPYFEPAEDKYIIHFTKTYVAAFGDEEGWDKPIGLTTEIIPLTRPFGLYAGNTFRGKVLVNGKPAANCDVEVEFFNQKRIKVPGEYYITQVVKTDKNGIFCYTPPAPGWWGFAGLNTANFTLPYKGKPKEVELGAVLWLYFAPWPSH